MSAPARSTSLVITLGTVLLLDTCGEYPQTAFASHRKDDASTYKGVEGDPFMAKNQIPGDRTNWENQVRTRDQYQNEYNKTSRCTQAEVRPWTFPGNILW